jgi:hypothetical protein
MNAASRGPGKVGALRVGRGRGGLVDLGRAALMGRHGALSRYFAVSGQSRDGGFRRTRGTGVLDDLSRRVGVLAKRAATAPSRVGVVCHDAADYQSGPISGAPEDPLATMAAAWRSVGPSTKRWSPAGRDRVGPWRFAGANRQAERRAATAWPEPRKPIAWPERREPTRFGGAARPIAWPEPRKPTRFG